ncbi:MAG: hypothetical protein LDL47_07730 [Cyanobacteria bacterium KgW148]|nr:hypothetical protein [Cyanobacteria bacterium KgW148]
MGNLNLEDRQSWQRFQRILTSFISDYIDLLAPEQVAIRYDQDALFLGFTLLSDRVDDQQVDLFIHQLEQFLKRLPLAGVNAIELNFYSVTDGDALLTHCFPVTYIAPVRAIVVASERPQSRRRGGSLVRRLRGLLTNPQLGRAIQTATTTIVRRPQEAIVAAGAFSQQKLNQALTWVDTFPWEDWAQRKVQWQQRRHRRNPIKALIEDVLFIGLIALFILFGGRLLSGPSLNLAALPSQHYDSAFANARYSCGPSGVTRKNYVCLRPGMSYNRVKQILGGDGKPLGIDPKFGRNADEAKKLLVNQPKPSLFSFLNRQKSVGEQVATIISWSDGKGGTLNATFLGNRLVARAYRDIS